MSQLREAGRLYGPDGVLLAMVRLLEHRDGSDRWEIRLNDPAPSATRTAVHPDEASARAELDRLYAEGGRDGEWTIRRLDSE
ncbi:hypothetical protein ACIBCR_16310 [Micromonospora echinospora]|uniref:hypothetical protein n=1 Tax=Micromonospora echinospora TaxID=1877 RepID=UPI0037ACC35A